MCIQRNADDLVCYLIQKECHNSRTKAKEVQEIEEGEGSKHAQEASHSFLSLHVSLSFCGVGGLSVD